MKYFQLFLSSLFFISVAFATDEAYEFVIPAQFDHIDSFSESLARFQSNGLCGFINEKGEIVIPAQFRFAEPFQHGRSIAWLRGSKERFFIDKAGKRLDSTFIPQVEDLVTHYIRFPHEFSFNDGLASYSEKGADSKTHYGFINTNYEVKLPAIYSYASSFHEGLAAVDISADGLVKTGFINAAGEIVIPPTYKNVDFFAEGLSRVSKDGNLYGFIDKAGKTVIPEIYGSSDISHYFSNGLVIASSDGAWQFLDKEGKIAAIPTWNKERYEIKSFEPFGADGLAAFFSEPAESLDEPLGAHWGTWGLMNKKGEVVIEPQFVDISSPVPGEVAMRVAQLGYKEFVMIHPIKGVLPQLYEAANDFSEGLAAVMVKDKFGYINTDGEWVISPQFETAMQFKGGIAAVKQNGKYGLIRLKK